MDTEAFYLDFVKPFNMLDLIVLDIDLKGNPWYKISYSGGFSEHVTMGLFLPETARIKSNLSARKISP